MCKSEVQSVAEVAESSKNILKSATFDEALERTGFGKFNYFLVILSGIILSSVLLETLSISYVLPVAENDLHLSTEFKGVLSSVSYAGIIASSHLSGFLADTQGRRKVIMLSLLLSFVCTIISSFIKNLWFFTVMRFLCGFFISGCSTTIYAYLGEFHGAKMQSKVVMGAAFVFGIMCICVPIIALLILDQDWILYISFLDIEYKPWRLFVLACGSLSLFSGICFIFLPESPKFVYTQGKNEKSLEILKRVYEINTGNSSKYFEINEISNGSDQNSVTNDVEGSWIKKILKLMWTQTAPLFQKFHMKNTFILCTTQFLIFITSSGLYMFFPEILNRSMEFIKMNPSTSSTICHALDETKLIAKNSTQNEKLELATYEYAFILEIIYAIGFAIIGALVNFSGKLLIIESILITCSLCAIAISFVSTMTLSIYLYVILLACGLSCNVVTSSTIEIFPTNLRAMAVSLSLMFGRLGSIFGSNIVGLLLDNHCEYTFLLSGLTLLLCCILVFFIPNISQRHSNDKSENDISQS